MACPDRPSRPPRSTAAHSTPPTPAGFSYVADIEMTREGYTGYAGSTGPNGDSLFKTSHTSPISDGVTEGYSRKLMEKQVAFTSCSPSSDLGWPKCEEGVTAVPTYTADQYDRYEVGVGDNLCYKTPLLGCCGYTCNHTTTHKDSVHATYRRLGRYLSIRI